MHQVWWRTDKEPLGWPSVVTDRRKARIEANIKEDRHFTIIIDRLYSMHVINFNKNECSLINNCKMHIFLNFHFNPWWKSLSLEEIRARRVSDLAVAEFAGFFCGWAKVALLPKHISYLVLNLHKYELDILAPFVDVKQYTRMSLTYSINIVW